MNTSSPPAQQVPPQLPQQAPSVVPPAEAEIQPANRKSIALVVCSTRPGRVNAAIKQYIASLLLPRSASYALATVDLRLWRLPLFDQPTIPAAMLASDPTPGYVSGHARAWSAEVRRHAAFVFVCPQYNWSMPASVKNALDYLYHEWVGKPAMVVSYGGHGGGKGKAALENVLTGLKMRVVGAGLGGVEMTISPREGMGIGDREGPEAKVPEELKQRWREAGVEEALGRSWAELVGLVEGKL